jgi:LPXTG-motif cell wall-anchored protein
VELAAGGPGGGDDTGSPVGVAVAAGVLLAVALGAVWLRRRRHPAAPG